MRDGWKEISLEDLETSGVIKLGRGDVISKKDMEADPGPNPVYSSAENKNGMIGKYAKFMFDEELITWSVDGGGHIFYRPKHKFSVTNIGGWLRILDDKVFSYQFLTYALQRLHKQHSFDWQHKAHPSVIRKLYTRIPLPPLPEQKRIVDLISSVDDYIEALQQQLESAKKSRNAVLHELLTEGGDDWIETTLGEICADGLFADGDWVESKDQDPEGDYRLLQLADIGDGTFLNKSDRWMNREQFNRLGCTKLEVNDVLIARMPDPIGRACLFPEGLPVCATVVDVAIVRTGNETLQKFLALLINSSDFRTEAFSLLTGTTRQRISRGNLAKISFVISSQEKQLEIVNLISLFDGEIAQSVRVIEEAKQLRSGLLSDLLSGEHEIPFTYDKVMGAA